MTDSVGTSREAVETFCDQAEQRVTEREQLIWVTPSNIRAFRALLSERDSLLEKVDELSVSIADAYAAGFDEAANRADELGHHCIGCGHLCVDPEKDLEFIRKSGARSCCPEREIEPLSEAIRALQPQQKEGSDE